MSSGFGAREAHRQTAVGQLLGGVPTGRAGRTPTAEAEPVLSHVCLSSALPSRARLCAVSLVTDTEVRRAEVLGALLRAD